MEENLRCPPGGFQLWSISRIHAVMMTWEAENGNRLLYLRLGLEVAIHEVADRL